MENFSVILEENLKRCIHATVDLKPGDVVMEDTPVLVIPSWESENMKCSNCLKESFIMCQKCLVFPMCIECKAHDAFDCELFQRADNISKDFLICYYSSYGALKCLLNLEKENSTQTGGINNLLQLDARLDEYIKSELCQEHQTKIIQPLLQSGISEYCSNINVNEDLLQRICSIMDLNAFNVTTTNGNSVRAIYSHALQIPHSCIPNATVAINDDFSLKVYATVPIKQNELIFISYVNPLMGTSQRQLHLKITKYINCRCPRCEDPYELGTYLSSLKCRSCDEGYVSHYNSKWLCEKCNAFVSEDDVNKLLASIAESLYDANGNIRKYEDLLTQYSSELHPNHFLVIDIKQNIASILRAVLTDSVYQFNKRILKRKIKLCEDILPIVRAVQPGISKLYGIALYEFVMSFIELATNEYDANEITLEEFKDKLIEAEDASKTAIMNIAHEFNNSPEGQLRQQMEDELTRITSLMLMLNSN